MIPSAIRRFTLTDGMILIAAVAVGFAGVRAESGNHYHPSSAYVIQDRKNTEFNFILTGTRPDWSIAAYKLAATANKAAPIVAALTLALVLIRFRRPRPSFRHLVRRPGLVAEFAAMATLGVNLLLGSLQITLAAIGQSRMNNPMFYANSTFLVCQTLQPGLVGMTVLASWAILALSGRWRPEASWIDRVGIIIGLAWGGLFITDWVVERLA